MEILPYTPEEFHISALRYVDNYIWQLRKFDDYYTQLVPDSRFDLEHPFNYFTLLHHKEYLRDNLVGLCNREILRYGGKLISVEVSYRNQDQLRELQAGCAEICDESDEGPRWAMTGLSYDFDDGTATFLFRDGQDAMLFKLAWA
jgi:hypothetical protein